MNSYAYCANNPLIYIDADGRFWNLIIPAVIEFAKAAIVEGAKAYAINVAAQYATNGQDWGKINWDSANQSFISGGIAGGLGGNGGLFKPGGNDIFSYSLAYGMNNGITNMAVGAALGRGNAWDNFTQGFGMGAAFGIGKWGYRNFVGYDPTMAAGKGVAGIDGSTKTELGKHAVKGLNNVGINIGGIAPDFMKSWFMEGGDVSNFLNQIPGVNSIAGLHDQMSVFYKKNFWGSLGSVIPAAIANTVVSYDQMAYYY